jgi:hypothetical protein
MLVDPRVVEPAFQTFCVEKEYVDLNLDVRRFPIAEADFQVSFCPRRCRGTLAHLAVLVQTPRRNENLLTRWKKLALLNTPVNVQKIDEHRSYSQQSAHERLPKHNKRCAAESLLSECSTRLLCKLSFICHALNLGILKTSPANHVQTSKTLTCINESDSKKVCIEISSFLLL